MFYIIVLLIMCSVMRKNIMVVGICGGGSLPHGKQEAEKVVWGQDIASKNLPSVTYSLKFSDFPKRTPLAVK